MKLLFIAVFVVAVGAVTTIYGGIGQAAPQRGEHDIVDQRPIPATPDYNGGIEGHPPPVPPPPLSLSPLVGVPPLLRAPPPPSFFSPWPQI